MPTVTSFLSNLTLIFEWAIGSITSVVDIILANPFLWVPLLMFFVAGGVIGLTRRLMGM